MWIVLTVLSVVAAIAIHFIWWRRMRRLETAWQAAQSGEMEKRQSLEAALKRCQEQQRTLIDHMGEGVVWLDSDLRIRLANSIVGRLLDASGPVEGQTLIQALRIHQVVELAEKAAANPSNGGLRLELTLPSRFIEVYASATREDSHDPPGVVLVFHDRTRVRQLENLRQEFVANVSHELRTPLTSIKGYVETLSQGAVEEPEVARRFLDKIARHSERMVFLVEDLLTLSHLESGRLAMEKRDCDFHALVVSALEDLAGLARERSFRMFNDVEPGLMGYGDAERIRQVLCNLVDNAIKYGRVGGTVRIGAAECNGRTEVWVEDDGPGIPEAARERVFERFFRLDRARSREHGGTGLGLSIVKHIIQSHGGTVGVDSQPGAGSRFFFLLPCRSKTTDEV